MRLRPCERLRSPTEFRALFRRGLRSDGPLFMMLGLGRSSGESRLGLTVGRRVGSAVRRNRVKRLLRECFRRNKPPVAVDVVLVAKREILDVKQAELDEHYRKRLRGLCRRLSASAGSAGALGGD